MSTGALYYHPAVYLWELVLRAKKNVSEETLQGLWSEIALLRQEVEKAERNKTASEARLTSAIAVAKARLQSRSDSYR